MAMSLATFYRTWPWPWPYVGVSYFFGETSCLYLHAMRYRSAGGPVPHPPHAHVWPWPRRHGHGHGHEFGHVLPRFAMAMSLSHVLPRFAMAMAMAMATFYRGPVIKAITTYWFHYFILKDLEVMSWFRCYEKTDRYLKLRLDFRISIRYITYIPSTYT